MKITKGDAEHVAHLARLSFDESELERFTHQLNDILVHMEELNEVDTAEVEPISHAMDLVNVFREDHVDESLRVEQALSNAPQSARGSFQVPRIIE